MALSRIIHGSRVLRTRCGGMTSCTRGLSSLADVDPVMSQLIQREHQRQTQGISLIASENFTSGAVMEALGSCFTNKTVEGYPGARFHGGAEVIDEMERLCQQRALDAFGLDPAVWSVNVQPYSGSIANMVVYTALLKPHDRIMGLDLPDGGHLTHGYMTKNRRISATSIFFESMPYSVDLKTCEVDYDDLGAHARRFKPRMIIAGGSAYPRVWDYGKYRKVADEAGAYLLMDMSHTAGLIAAGVNPSPFEYFDVVTTTTYKTLRGPRAGLIFSKKELQLDKKVISNVGKKIEDACFPGIQGTPHLNTVAAIAVALHESKSDKFVQYQKDVVRNAQAMARVLTEKGYTIVTGGTDTHQIMVDLRPRGIDGARVDFIADNSHLYLNKNTVPGQTNALIPAGIRLGSPTMTTRGFTEQDFCQAMSFLDEAVEISIRAKASCTSDGKFATFKSMVPEKKEIWEDVLALREKIHNYTSSANLSD